MRVGDWIAVAGLLLAGSGCGAELESTVNTRNFAASAPAAAPLATPAEDADRVPASPAEASKAATAGRKIIHTAHVELVTEDLSALESKLLPLVETSKGYVADSDVSGTAGIQRQGTWRVRVPVEAYDAFLKAAVRLGELVSLKADAKDVSEEYFDLEARLANKKVEEARLLKLLTEATGKLEEVLKVEHELSRVREEIERFQGRLRALANLTTLTTVTISAREIKGYTPPLAPTLATRMGRTFAASLDALRQLGEGLLLFAVGLVPWLPVIGLVLVFVLIASRRARRRA